MAALLCAWPWRTANGSTLSFGHVAADGMRQPATDTLDESSCPGHLLGRAPRGAA